MPRGRPSRKYAPLRAHLASQRSDVAEATLTYRELAALLGARLPASAWERPFWSNHRTRVLTTPQERAWQAAGWRVRSVVPGLWVTFARAG